MKAQSQRMFLAALFCATVLHGNAQLRVDQSGRVGLGTYWPNPGYKLHVKGDMLLTTYPEVPAYPGSTFVEMKMKLGNGYPGAELGTNVDHIALWSSESGYNKLSVEVVYQESDSSNKTNIRKLSDPMLKLRRLNGYKYEMKRRSDEKMSTRYGLIAQEVLQVLPEATDSAKGILLVDYSQVIPLLVEALKAESNAVSCLENEIEELKEALVGCCAKSDLKISESRTPNAASRPKLFQNRPNPFNERTVIEYELPLVGGSSASIMIFDMNGTLKASHAISSAGRGGIAVEGSQLVAGMYLYSLVVDGTEVETKRMILTE